jgi:hypothetical protein
VEAAVSPVRAALDGVGRPIGATATTG